MTRRDAVDRAHLVRVHVRGPVRADAINRVPTSHSERGRHGRAYPSTHSSPLVATSFFQIGTVVLSVSMM
jgi:hypothetical protein